MDSSSQISSSYINSGYGSESFCHEGEDTENSTYNINDKFDMSRIGPMINKSKIYLTFSRLGEGSYGKVIKAYYYGNEVAVKFLDTRKHNLKEIEKCVAEEVKILAKIKSPNIVTFYGFNLNPPFIVTEFCPNGSLYEIIEFARLYPTSKAAKELQSWKKRLSLALKISDGMRYLHDKENEIIHGDLKSPNIIIDRDGNAKITDFGLSCFIKYDDGNEINENEVSSFNPLWSAPELLADSKISKKCDVFSFAIILWELLMFRRPYDLSEHDHAGPFRIALQIMEDDLRPEIPNDRKKIPGSWDPILEKYITLINNCWQKDPDDRPNFPYIKKRLLLIQNALFPSTALSEYTIKMDNFGDISEIIQQMKSFKSKPFQQQSNSIHSISNYFKCILIVICLLFMLLSMFISLLSVIFTSCDHYDHRKGCRKENDDDNVNLPFIPSNDSDIDNHNETLTESQITIVKSELDSNPNRNMDDDDIKYLYDEELNEYPDFALASSPLPIDDNNYSHYSHLKVNNSAKVEKVKFEDIKLPIIIIVVLVSAILLLGFFLSYIATKNRKRQEDSDEENHHQDLEKFPTQRLSNLLEDIRDENEIGIVGDDDIARIKAISNSFNLPVVTYEVPSEENWEKLRYIIMDYLEKNDLYQQEKFALIYDFLRQHVFLETQKEWIDFFTILFSIPNLNTFGLWDQINDFFVCS